MHGHMSYQNILYLHKLLDPYNIAFSLKAKFLLHFMGHQFLFFLPIGKASLIIIGIGKVELRKRSRSMIMKQW